MLVFLLQLQMVHRNKMLIIDFQKLAKLLIKSVLLSCQNIHQYLLWHLVQFLNYQLTKMLLLQYNDIL